MLRFLLIALLSVHSAWLYADNIDDLMHLSGMNSTLDNLPEQITAGLQTNSTPDAIEQTLQAVMQENFASAKMQTMIANYLRAHLDKPSTQQSLTWLRSPLGAKVTALESANNSLEAQAEMQKQIPILLKDTRRFALIRELDKAINASQSTIKTLLRIQEAMVRGMMTANTSAPQLNDDELHEMIANSEPQIRAQYEVLVVGSMAYNYRSLSDAEIRQYIDFAQSPAGINYHKNMMAALDQAMQSASRAIGASLGKLMPKDGTTNSSP